MLTVTLALRPNCLVLNGHLLGTSQPIMVVKGFAGAVSKSLSVQLSLLHAG